VKNKVITPTWKYTDLICCEHVQGYWFVCLLVDNNDLLCWRKDTQKKRNLLLTAQGVKLNRACRYISLCSRHTGDIFVAVKRSPKTLSKTSPTLEESFSNLVAEPKTALYNKHKTKNGFQSTVSANRLDFAFKQQERILETSEWIWVFHDTLLTRKFPQLFFSCYPRLLLIGSV
jgi:hypothetical protein